MSDESLFGFIDDEQLSSSIEEVTDRAPEGKPIEVRVFRRMKVNPARLAERTLERIIEDLDEDYAGIFLTKHRWPTTKLPPPLSEWWEQQQQADLEAKLFADVANGARVAKEVERLASEAPTQVGVLVKLIERLIVQVSVRGELPQQVEQLPDLVRTALAAMKVQQDERSLAIDEAKLAILQRKAEQAEKAEKVVNDDTLTPEDKAAKIRAVFGMA